MEDYINTHVYKIGWINLAKDMLQCQILVNTIMNLQGI